MNLTKEQIILYIQCGDYPQGMAAGTFREAIGRMALQVLDGCWVPREPTQQMAHAGMNALAKHAPSPRCVSGALAEKVYEAMISAAQGEAGV